MIKDLAEKIKKISLNLYSTASDFAREKGIIIADTKFEFGMLGDKIVLIDEVLTSDSSRFWPLDDYAEGKNQKSFDKQYLRDYLQDLVDNGKWDKDSEAPLLPQEVLDVTSSKYKEALEIITK